MTQTTVAEEAITNKALAAATVGIDESKILAVGLELDVLRREGILIDLDVTGVGMFTRAASFSELGIGADDEKRERYSAGSKYLIPKDKVDELRSVESRMRQCFDKYTRDVQGFRPWRWLGYKAWAEFRKRWEALAAEFEECKAGILAGYDGYLDAISADYAAGARRSWVAIQAQGYGAVIVDGKGYDNEADFVDAVVASAHARMPSPEKIENELLADYRVAVVYGQQDYAADQAAASAHQQAQKLAVAATEHEAQMMLLAEQEKRVAIEAMRAAEMEHARTQLEAMRSPLVEVVGALRAQIANDCTEIAASIKKNGFVRGKVAERGRGLLELYDLLATHNDAALRSKLVALHKEIGAVGDERTKDTPERDTEAIKAALQEVIALAHAEVEELEEVSRAAFLIG